MTATKQRESGIYCFSKRQIRKEEKKRKRFLHVALYRCSALRYDPNGFGLGEYRDPRHFNPGQSSIRWIVTILLMQHRRLGFDSVTVLHSPFRSRRPCKMPNSNLDFLSRSRGQCTTTHHVQLGLFYQTSFPMISRIPSKRLSSIDPRT